MDGDAGHAAIAELERRGKLHALITQNIDGLHQRAGNSPQRAGSRVVIVNAEPTPFDGIADAVVSVPIG